MRNFLKTAGVLLVVSVAAFAQNVNSQAQIERFDRMKKAGTGMIIGGAALGTTGFVMSAVNLVKADDYTGLYYSIEEAQKAQEKIDMYEGRAVAWYLTSSVFYSVMAAGIPIRIVGRVRGNNLRNVLPNSAYIVPNGVNLSWNF